MAHHPVNAGYFSLSKRLNKFPQGVVPTDLLFQILKILFTEREAKLVSLLPIKPFTAKKASDIWNMNLESSKQILNQLAEKGLLLDIENENGITYIMPPPMAGFFEFSLMRYRNDIDQKKLAELFYQYMNVEEDFIKNLFFQGETQLGRAFVNESVLTNENAIHVLDYDRASYVIKTASHIGIGVCYCRHKMLHVGKNCSAPLDICMTFNNTAESLTKHGIARKIDVKECMDLLNQAYDHNLVQFGDNVQKRVNFICNCCGCCCEAMIAAKRFAVLNPIHTTPFIPQINQETCVGCGKCVSLCPVEGMTLVSANDPHDYLKKKAKLDEDRCLGCGVCVRGCKYNSISLISRKHRVITPINSIHRAVMMAIERGDLQNLIFDNQVLLSHRAMAAVLGVILNLPPIKQAIATAQFKSRYLLSLINIYQ
ncbi:MAG: 4Fe-4S dicluster domain-containing protein [Desulfobacterales bacterium]|nr:4Fe-4S dicluster domain-containing protein [Desulfobacterales bacterium]